MHSSSTPTPNKPKKMNTDTTPTPQSTSDQTTDRVGVGRSELLGVVEPRWWECTLDQCPPGLFRINGYYGFKTEYRDDNGPEAYCVESGEYFWGGTDGDAEARRNLKVQPVIISSPNEDN